MKRSEKLSVVLFMCLLLIVVETFENLWNLE